MFASGLATQVHHRSATYGPHGLDACDDRRCKVGLCGLALRFAAARPWIPALSSGSVTPFLLASVKPSPSSAVTPRACERDRTGFTVRFCFVLAAIPDRTRVQEISSQGSSSSR